MLACALLVAGVYALDRVKLRDRYAEPGDRLADADRHEAIRSHAGFVRALSITLVLAATGIFALTSPDMLWTIPAGPLAVLLYAGAPGRWFSLKSIPGLKNSLVAVSFVLLASAALGWPESLRRPSVAGLIALRVLIDAALCDLDDAEADRAQGTHTLATLIGPTAAAGALMLAELPYALWMLRLAHSDAAAVWAIAVPASTALLLLLRPRRLGDWIDARLGLLTLTPLALAWLNR